MFQATDLGVIPHLSKEKFKIYQYTREMVSMVSKLRIPQKKQQQ